MSDVSILAVRLRRDFLRANHVPPTVVEIASDVDKVLAEDWNALMTSSDPMDPQDPQIKTTDGGRLFGMDVRVLPVLPPGTILVK